MTGNAQRRAIAAAPYVFTIVFFVLWEAACRLFKIPVFFLPAPSVIAQASVEYWSQLLFHSFHTLWMTLAGFGIVPRTVPGLIGIAFSPLLHASPAHLLANALPLFVLLVLLFWDRHYYPVLTLCLIWFFSGANRSI